MFIILNQISMAKNVLRTNMLSPLLQSLTRHSTNPFEYRLTGYGNGQKIVRTITPSSIGAGATFFNKTVTFDIPKSGYLSQIILQSTLTCSGDNTNVQDRLGSRIFKNISLETTQGNRKVQSIEPDYTNCRIDDLPYDKFNAIEPSTNPDITFSNSTISVFTPLFFSAFERPENYFDTLHLEQMQITAITNDSATLMGLPSNTLTSWTFTMYCTYFFMQQPNMSLNRTLLSFDCYHEAAIALTTGQTTQNIFLECDKTCLNIHAVIRNSQQEYFSINSLALYSVGKEIIPTLDRRINYSMFDGETENNSTGTFTYWFGLNRSRINNAISINLNDLDTPMLTVNFSSLPDSTYSLYVFEEYWSVVTTNTYGTIARSNIY